MIEHVSRGHAFYQTLSDKHLYAVVYWGRGKYDFHDLGERGTWDGSKLKEIAWEGQELKATVKVPDDRDVEATARQIMATMAAKLRRAAS